VVGGRFASWLGAEGRAREEGEDGDRSLPLVWQIVYWTTIIQRREMMLEPSTGIKSGDRLE
jgi:hypothetical protein